MSLNTRNKKVNFIIIGAMKSGTTTASSMLAQHPDISIHVDKEPNFFSSGLAKDIQYYHQGYDANKEMWGEASTDYSKHLKENQSIANNIYDYNSEMKIIYIVRNPIDRIVSDYLHLHARGYIACDFSTALKTVEGLIDRSRYASQLTAFENTFPTQNILVLDYKYLKNDYMGFINTIQRFIGVNTLNVEIVSKNKSVGNRKYLARYDSILHKTPNWIKAMVPKFLKVYTLNKMTGPMHNVKPKPSSSEIEYISSELYKEIAIMQNHYGVLKDIDTKTLHRT